MDDTPEPALKDGILQALETCHDPELLDLIYKLLICNPCNA